MLITGYKLNQKRELYPFWPVFTQITNILFCFLLPAHRYLNSPVVVGVTDYSLNAHRQKRPPPTPPPPPPMVKTSTWSYISWPKRPQIIFFDLYFIKCKADSRMGAVVAERKYFNLPRSQGCVCGGGGGYSNILGVCLIIQMFWG